MQANVPPLGERVPGTRRPHPAGTAVVRRGGWGHPPRRGKVRREGLGAEEDAATPRSGSGVDDKREKLNCSLKKEKRREGRGEEAAWDGRAMGAVPSLRLGALVADFVVLRAGTGWVPWALAPSTPRKAGLLLLGKWEKLL